MVLTEKKLDSVFIAVGVFLLCFGLFFPMLTQTVWFNIIVRIKEAINAGDSGHLILAAASANFLYAVESTSLYLGAIFVIYHTIIRQVLGKMEITVMSFVMIVFLHWTNSFLSNLSWEPVSTVLALLITLFLFEKTFEETNNFLHVSIVSVQVFFAFQWLNIMPLFSAYRIGQGDIPNSIKIAAVYLQAASVLNFTGFAFFLPFLVSAFITATLFVSYSQNIMMMKVNYQKESEIRDMREKALENRIYKEVKSLVHDLKTPLVTIRGLNSLLAVSKDEEKLVEYSDRIENSVTKMSEMISSFLYENSRQDLKVEELTSYIRAQLPLEDENVKIEIKIAPSLPEIHINKIRIARAVINILENAIIVPCMHPQKNILFEVKSNEKGIEILITDNGIGIKEENLLKIWEVGFSTNNTSGLGLPFARQVIEDNGGTIDIKSRENYGTEVTIFLPSAENLQESSN